MVAGIRIQIGLCRLPAGIPYRIAVFDIVIFAICVVWNIIVAVSCNAQKLGIFIKAVSAAGIRYE